LTQLKSEVFTGARYSFDKGVLIIKGNRREEEKDKGKKYYRQASRSFFYRVNILGQINESKEPEASFHNGVLEVKFMKSSGVITRKIPIKKAA
jgi:HSP20 family protein